jgi:hypothetical protein
MFVRLTVSEGVSPSVSLWEVPTGLYAGPEKISREKSINKFLLIKWDSTIHDKVGPHYTINSDIPQF